MNIIFIFIFTSCGYRICTDITQEKRQTTNHTKSVILCSYDPFGSITRAIRTELYANKIDFFDNLNDLPLPYKQEKNIPCLYVVNASEKRITTFIFNNGREAGYQLILHVQVDLFVPNKDSNPINIYVCRTFIRNPEKALHNNTQENDMRKEMFQDAAQQLIYQLFMMI